jgi:hypothetical protein
LPQHFDIPDGSLQRLDVLPLLRLGDDDAVRAISMKTLRHEPTTAFALRRFAHAEFSAIPSLFREHENAAARCAEFAIADPLMASAHQVIDVAMKRFDVRRVKLSRAALTFQIGVDFGHGAAAFVFRCEAGDAVHNSSPGEHYNVRRAIGLTRRPNLTNVGLHDPAIAFALDFKRVLRLHMDHCTHR